MQTWSKGPRGTSKGSAEQNKAADQKFFTSDLWWRMAGRENGWLASFREKRSINETRFQERYGWRGWRGSESQRLLKKSWEHRKKRHQMLKAGKTSWVTGWLSMLIREEQWKIREVGKFGLKTNVCNLPVFCFYLKYLLYRSHEAEGLQVHWKYAAVPWFLHLLLSRVIVTSEENHGFCFFSKFLLPFASLSSLPLFIAHLTNRFLYFDQLTL